MGTFINTDEQRKVLTSLPDDNARTQMLQTWIDKGYEVEGLNFEYTPGEMFRNAAPSFVKSAKDLWYGTKEMAKFVYGGMAAKQLDTTPEQIKANIGKDDKSIPEQIGESWDTVKNLGGALGHAFKNRYGTGERILNTLEKDPFGFISDASIIFALGAGGSKVLGNKLANVAGMTKNANAAQRLTKASKFLQEAGEKSLKYGNMIEPTVLVGETLPKLTKKMIHKNALLHNKISRIDEVIDNYLLGGAQKSLGVEPGRLESLAQDVLNGDRAIEFLGRYGVHGTLPEMVEQTGFIARRSKKILNEEINKIDATFSGIKQKQMVNKALDEMMPDMTDFLDDAVIRADYKKMSAIKKRTANEGFTLSDAQFVKEKFKDYAQKTFGKGRLSGIEATTTVADNIAAKRRANIYTEMKGFIEDEAFRRGFTDVKFHNDTIRGMTPLNKALKGAHLKFANRLDILDAIFFLSGVTGSLYYGPAFLLGGLGVTGFRFYMKSTKFGTAMANNIMARNEKQFNTVIKALQEGNYTKEAKHIMSDVVKDLQPAFPQLRLVGRLEQEKE